MRRIVRHDAVVGVPHETSMKGTSTKVPWEAQYAGWTSILQPCLANRFYCGPVPSDALSGERMDFMGRLITLLNRSSKGKNESRSDLFHTSSESRTDMIFLGSSGRMQ